MVSGANSQEVVDTNLPHTNGNDTYLDENYTEILSLQHDQMACDTNDEERGCFFSIPDIDPETFTMEEIAIFAHIPGYVPYRQSVAWEENNEGESEPRSRSSVNVLLLVDEEAQSFFSSFKPWELPAPSLQDWAEQIFYDGTDYLGSNYNIALQIGQYDTWSSPNNVNYTVLLTNLLASSIVKNSGCDVVALLTGQPETGGIDGVGYGKDLGVDGSGMILNIQIAKYGLDVAIGFQHEMSHLFGCKDGGHDHSTGQSCPCVMCRYCCAVSYTEYCYDCEYSLWINEYRYNAKGYTTDTSDDSQGSGTVTAKDNLIGSLADRQYTCMYSGGNSGGSPYNKAVLYAKVVNIKNPSSSLSGNVYLRGYSISANSHLIVYTSNDKTTWNLLKETNFKTNPTAESGAYDHDMGYASNFKYVCLVVINDHNCTGNLYFDTLRVF